MARLLEGKDVSDAIAEQLKAGLAGLDRKLKLVGVSVGTHSASDVYLKAQERAAGSLGIEYEVVSAPEDISRKDLCVLIDRLNADRSVTGIILQTPLPRHLRYTDVCSCISPEKDVEGMNPVHMGNMMLGNPAIVPCTAAAVFRLLSSEGIDFEGKEVVIVGHSAIVGKPLSVLLLNALATVTVCHVGTTRAGNLEEHVRRADILIVAVGKAGLIKGDWIKAGAVVIDVGINKSGKTIVGDVEFRAACAKASVITPVPGGVGPVTVMMLMYNLLEAARMQSGRER